MRRLRQHALYLATFGSMTAAALVVIALIVLDGDGGSDRDRYEGSIVSTVVAAQDIPAGTEIKATMLTVAAMREELVVAGAFSGTQPVVGQVTKVPFAEGEQITASKLGPPVPSSGVGNIHMPPGTRALSFEAEPVTTEGERVLPSNRVDIVIERDGGASTVIENVMVLAVESPRTPICCLTWSPSVTVAVSPEQAQLLAETMSSGGKIRLSRPA